MAESKSLADRMTFPSESESKDTPPEVSDRTEEQPAAKDDGSVANAQTDGAIDQNGASNGTALREPEFDVEVKLSDLQADPNNPLYSAKTFEQLNLSVSCP